MADPITREQVERAIEGMRDDAGAKPDHLAYADSPVWDDGPLPTPTPERPAPRFKEGDWVTDLRTLAQAVVTAYETWHGERHASVGRDYAVIDDCRARYYAACAALDRALALQPSSSDADSARAILAALDAADAQGYARAMGEVVERCEATVSGHVQSRRWDTRVMGMCDEAENIAEWASERLPAAAERD